MNLASYKTEYDYLIHPQAEIYAGGWKSDVGTLTRYGWVVELQKEAHLYDSCVLYVRNPSKHMVGRCTIENLHMKQYETHYGAVAYMDEQILVKADMYRDMQIPRMELWEVGVAEVHNEHARVVDLQMYTPDKQETEIIVTPEKVGMLLEKIREAQVPKAKKIIHNQHKRDYQKLEAKATILAFG